MSVLQTSAGSKADNVASPRGTAAIEEAFARGEKEGRSLFIPFLVAGDPDLATTDRLLDALVAGGADLIELGVPFSDPIADGPVNQRAAFRALESGTTLDGVLDVVARFRKRSGVPLILFTYLNPIHARGIDLFAEQAAARGVDGVLFVDVPPEEGREIEQPMARQGLSAIYLLSPTSTRERIKRVAAASSGFVYYVSRTGVTGERGELPTDLVREVKGLRRRVKLPVAVGFGISSPDQAAAVAKVADGVVVGSALVRLVEENAGLELDSLSQKLESKVAELSAPLGRKKR